MSRFYNNYHRSFVKTGSQKKLIDRSNFTYFNFFRYVLPIIKKLKFPPNKPNNKKLLDVGCGAGTLSLLMASMGFTVEGIDISDIAIETAKKSTSNLNLTGKVKFQVKDVNEISAKSTFDLIFCLEVLEHIQKDKMFLAKLFNLLSNRGLLILSVPLKSAPILKFEVGKSFDKQVGHLRRYSEKDIIFLVKEVGFSPLVVIKTEGLLRNSLFVVPLLRRFVRFIKGPISFVITFVDDVFGRFLGYSDLILILTK